MPFQSKKQQRFAYANPEKFGGKKGLKEWADKTDFDNLPEKKEKSRLVLPIEKAVHQRKLKTGKVITVNDPRQKVPAKLESFINKLKAVSNKINLDNIKLTRTEKGNWYVAYIDGRKIGIVDGQLLDDETALDWGLIDMETFNDDLEKSDKKDYGQGQRQQKVMDKKGNLVTRTVGTNQQDSRPKEPTYEHFRKNISLKRAIEARKQLKGVMTRKEFLPKLKDSYDNMLKELNNIIEYKESKLKKPVKIKELDSPENQIEKNLTDLISFLKENNIKPNDVYASDLNSLEPQIEDSVFNTQATEKAIENHTEAMEEMTEDEFIEEIKSHYKDILSNVKKFTPKNYEFLKKTAKNDMAKLREDKEEGWLDMNKYSRGRARNIEALTSFSRRSNNFISQAVYDFVHK